MHRVDAATCSNSTSLRSSGTFHQVVTTRNVRLCTALLFIRPPPQLDKHAISRMQRLRTWRSGIAQSSAALLHLAIILSQRTEATRLRHITHYAHRGPRLIVHTLRCSGTGWPDDPQTNPTEHIQGIMLSTSNAQLTLRSGSAARNPPNSAASVDPNRPAGPYESVLYILLHKRTEDATLAGARGPIGRHVAWAGIRLCSGVERSADHPDGA